MKTGYLSYQEFLSICGEFMIDPAIALESEVVKDAIRSDDRKSLRKALQEEF